MDLEIIDDTKIFADILRDWRAFFVTLKIYIEPKIILFKYDKNNNKYTILQQMDGSVKSVDTDYTDTTYDKFIQKSFPKDKFFHINKISINTERASVIFTPMLVIDNKYNEILDKIDPSLLDASILNYSEEYNFGKNPQQSINAAAKSLMLYSRQLLNYKQLNAITALKYESVEVKSNLIITPLTVAERMKKTITFVEPVDKTNYKIVRKLLEIATDEIALIGSNSKFHGFAYIEEIKNLLKENNFFDEPIYKISLNGVLLWEIEKYNQRSQNFLPYIASKTMTSSYPHQKIPEREFIDKLVAKFGSSCNKTALWEIVQYAMEQKKGTMIVISEVAKRESERLLKCSIKIETEQLTGKNIIKYLSAIDGAIMCDPYGYVHSIGMILDGRHHAENAETISRGARYNSAHRYNYKNEHKCLIVIVSEDGDVTLV